MTEQVAKDIYRIRVPLPDNPLRATNSYWIKGEKQELLIDTGFNLPACRSALKSALGELGSKRERRAVIATHMHADHMGLAAGMAGEGQPVYMSQADIDYYREEVGKQFDENRFRTIVSEGFPPGELKAAMEINEKRIVRPDGIPSCFKGLQDGEEIEAGEYRLKLLLVPGHSPGNSMLYEPGRKILFTGDHVLFDISPNITSFPGFRNALGQYLENLRKYRDLEVELALPGHRESGNYRERVGRLLDHHARRLQETGGLVLDHPGMSAYDIAGHMTWNIRSAKGWEDFPLQQKYYAMGECLAHLDYLLEEGKIRKEKGGKGIFVYFSS